jgi:hypothetical protein
VPSWGEKRYILSPKKARVYTNLSEILAERESLPSEAQGRFDRQISQVATNMKQVAEGYRILESLLPHLDRLVPRS